MKRFATGLVVGKFCPLHRGHELTIRRALAECARVYVLSYTNPEFPGCEPVRREQWLAQLFPETERLVLSQERWQTLGNGVLPQNDASEEEHRRLVAYVCEQIWRVRPEAVFTSEDYGAPFAARLAQLFGQPVAHVSVDRARAQVPVSGTQLRVDVHAHRGALSPQVYASFVERVCLLGGESSGKTTLAAALAAHWATEWVPEYGRELWVAQGGQLAFEDLLTIGREQVAREGAATLCAHRFLFCDTSPLTTLFYSVEMFGRSDPELEALAQRRYDHTILCSPDFPFEQDGTRRDSPFRDRQQEWYRQRLAARNTSFIQASGAVTARLNAVHRVLGGQKVLVAGSDAQLACERVRHL